MVAVDVIRPQVDQLEPAHVEALAIEPRLALRVLHPVLFGRLCRLGRRDRWLQAENHAPYISRYSVGVRARVRVGASVRVWVEGRACVSVRVSAASVHLKVLDLIDEVLAVRVGRCVRVGGLPQRSSSKSVSRKLV